MTMNVPDRVKRVMKIVQEAGYEIYIVGGCVRDMLMGVEPHDWDMCTNAKPFETLEIFSKLNITTFPKGIAYGTVSIIFDGEEFEITTYRTESDYADNRHPSEVKFVTELQQDLSRRDLTINALAYNPNTDELVDCFGGVDDIKNHIIRTVNNPNDRFTEDSLRMLRVVRFAIKYGFDIEENTFNALLNKDNLNRIKNVSKERVTMEFEKIFATGKPVTDMFLKVAPLIFTLIPSLKPCYKFNQNNKYHKHDVFEHMLNVVDNCKTTDLVIKLAALLHDIGKPNSYVTDDAGFGHFYGHPEISFEIVSENIDKDFRLSNAQKTRLLDLIHYHDMSIVPTKHSCRRAISKFGMDFMEDWFILKQADIDDHIFTDVTAKPDWVNLEDVKSVCEKVIEEENCFSLKDLEINGNDVMEQLHLKAGKEVGIILQKVFEKVMADELPNEREVLLEALPSLQ